MFKKPIDQSWKNFSTTIHETELKPNLKQGIASILDKEGHIQYGKKLVSFTSRKEVDDATNFNTYQQST